MYLYGLIFILHTCKFEFFLVSLLHCFLTIYNVKDLLKTKRFRMKKIKIKDKIYLNDWLKLHPNKMQVSSDIYYINLSNRFLEKIDFVFGNEISTKTKRTVALSVAAYFEDVISGLGLWQGFTKKHFAMYGKYLPFHRLTEVYIPDEINLEDILFLIWSIMQPEILKTRKTILNPENPGIKLLGVSLFTIIDKEYETAPENEELQNFFTEKVNYDNFYEFREVVSWLYYNSYLIAPYTEGDQEDALKEVKKHKEHADLLAYSLLNELIFKNPCGPLALKTYEWMSSIVGEDTDLGKMLLQTKFRYKMPKSYLVTDKNDSGITLLPFDSNDTIFLSNDTMQDDVPVKQNDAVFCNLVYFNSKWELNGFIMNISTEEYNKNKEEAKRKKENIEHSRNAYLKANNNNPIRYFKDGEELKTFFNKAYSLKEEIKENLLDDQKNIITFSNAENGVTTLSDIALYIKDKNNPYYDPEEAKDSGLMLLGGYDLFQELIEYLVKNKLIPDLCLNSLEGEKRGRELVQENLDFMFRYYQPHSYM